MQCATLLSEVRIFLLQLSMCSYVRRGTSFIEPYLAERNQITSVIAKFNGAVNFFRENVCADSPENVKEFASYYAENSLKSTPKNPHNHFHVTN